MSKITKGEPSSFENEIVDITLSITTGSDPDIETNKDTCLN